MQMYDLNHRANNTILHHSAKSLSLGVRVTDDRVSFDVGSSDVLVPKVLEFAFWTLRNTFSLVVDEDVGKELTALYGKHRPCISVLARAARGDNRVTTRCTETRRGGGPAGEAKPAD